MSDFVTVEIPQGKLRGKRGISNANGATYYSFQGIPYAKPPVGPLRFKPPEDPEPWNGTRDATMEGAAPPQIDLTSKTFVGDEDCLFLNVYTSQWPTISPTAVMVWVHGGAFVMNSGSAIKYGPDFLVAEDVIVVSINYRLGALGFMYLEGSDVTGNNGLRDQVMALKWVKKNIEYFGGDPDNVTIFGQSAGGACVHGLMLSPLSTGLFHRAVAQSGTALLCGDITPRHINSQRSVRFAKLLGCLYEDPQSVADFLRTVPAEKIATFQFEYRLEEEKGRILCMPFYLGEEVGPEAFLPLSARKLLQEGQYKNIPFMTGVTSADGEVFLRDMFLRSKLSELDQPFVNVLPLDLAPDTTSERSKEIANIIKKYYFGGNPVDDDSFLQLTDMLTDLMFVYPLHVTVKSHVTWSSHPTYVYLFDHISGCSVSSNPLPGAPHSAELPYLFQRSLKNINFQPGSVDTVLRERLVKLWTQFAKTGNPLCDAEKETWTRAEKGKLNYLRIKEGFSMDSDMFKERIVFLEEVYKTYLHH